MRSLEELVNEQEPGIDLVRGWMEEAAHPVELLSCERQAGARALLSLQLTTRSPLGALAYESGGLLVDHGWLRLLGAGCPRLPRGLADWNGLGGAPRLPGALLVGDDILGGFFALNGGGLPGAGGKVFYYAPDTLEWEDTGRGYSDWLYWAFTGDLEAYYEGTRWAGWQQEVAAIPGERALHFHPPLFAKAPSIEARSRRAVPIEELWGLNVIEFPKQLGIR